MFESSTADCTKAETEEAFFEAMAAPAAGIAHGLRVLWVTPDESRATTYARTEVEVPEEGEPAGPLFARPSEIVSPTNGRWINSTVRCTVFLVMPGEPILSWERNVGVVTISGSDFTFGLISANTDTADA